MKDSHLTMLVGELTHALARKSSVKDWEVYGQEQQGISITAERGAIKTAQSASSKEYAVRVFGSKGNMGFAHSNILTTPALERTVQTAVKMLSATTPDPDYKQLAEREDFPVQRKQFFDKKTAELTIEEVFEILQLMLDRHSSDVELYSTSGGVEVGSTTTIIHNSNGIAISEQHSQIFEYFEAIIKRNGQQSGGLWWDSANAIKYLNPEQISDISVERAKKGLPRHEVISGDYPVILSPNAIDTILLRPLIRALSAENIQYQRTFLGNPLDQKIGSDLLNLKDDPFEPRLTGSRYADDEGVPTRTLDLVKGGVVTNLLHNSYTAFKVGVKPNGHASRNSVGSVPSIDANNEIFMPGDQTLEELCEGIKYGIYVDDTGDSPNLASGDFSGLILRGFVIKKGVVGPALKNTMLGINLRDLLNRIDAIGKDLTIRGSSKIPHVRISTAKITSGV